MTVASLWPEQILALVSSALLALAGLARHPAHGSVAELRQTSASGFEVLIRVSQEDLERAVPGAGRAAADSALARYVRRGFSVARPSGPPVELRWKGARRAGDLLRLRLEGESPGGLAGAMVAHTLLLERVPDQVNVLRASYEGRTATLLFLPGDGAKRLP